MRRHNKEDCKREILRGNKEESKNKRDNRDNNKECNTEIEIPRDNKKECKRERKERYVETKRRM